jgi:hypothetical protein
MNGYEGNVKSKLFDVLCLGNFGKATIFEKIAV